MSFLKYILLLFLLFETMGKASKLKSEIFRNLQEEEEEDDYDDEYIPIKTYQRRTINIGASKKEVYRIFTYHIRPKKGETCEMTLDFYQRFSEEVIFYLYTDPDQIYYNPNTREFENGLFNTDLDGVDQLVIDEGDFLKEEGNVYLVFSAPNIEAVKNYLFVSLTNEVYEVDYLFRYTYYNVDIKTYYYHIDPRNSEYLYFQFQCLTTNPRSEFAVYEDEEFSKEIYGKTIRKPVFSDFIKIKEIDYYVSLKLELEDEDEPQGHFFDIAFTFHNQPKPILTEFIFGQSEEFPVVVPQYVYFVCDIENYQDERLLIKLPYLPDKVESFDYAFYTADSIDDFVNDIDDDDFTKNEESTSYDDTNSYVLIKRKNNKVNYLVFRPYINASAIHDYDTIEYFYALKIIDDPVNYGNFQTENENYLYVQPKDFDKFDADVLVFSCSKPYNIEILDFYIDGSAYYNMDYLTKYKDQFFFIEKSRLKNEILVLFNVDMAYVEIRYQFIPSFELLNDNFPGSGNVFNLYDCSKNYFLIWPGRDFSEESERTYIFYRPVLGYPEVSFGRIFDANNDINAIFNNKYYDTESTFFDANDELLIRIECEIPSSIHLMYFDSGRYIPMQRGNFYPILLNPLVKPRTEKEVIVIDEGTLNIEIEMIKDEGIIEQSFRVNFNNLDYDIDRKNSKITLQAKNYEEDTSFSFYLLKGKMLTFIKIGLDKEDYILVNEDKKFDKVPEKILIFPLDDLKDAQKFTIKNPSSIAIYMCIFSDYSNVYIDPRKASCHYIDDGDTENFMFYLKNSFKNVETSSKQNYYTAISFDDTDISLEYKLEKNFKEQKIPGYNDDDGLFNVDTHGMRFTLYILLCIVIFGGLFIMFVVKKGQKEGNDYLQFAEAAGFSEDINL